MKLILLLFSVSSLVSTFSQGIAINLTGAAPNSSAILDVSSTDKGLLIPRMTTPQRTIAGAPGGLLNALGELPQAAEGLTVYDVTLDRLFYNISTTVIPIWVSLIPSSAASRINTFKGMTNDDTFDMLDSTWYTMDQMVTAYTPTNNQVHIQFQTLLRGEDPFPNGCAGFCYSDILFAVSVNGIIQPQTIRLYPRGFFQASVYFLYEINFTVPISVTPGIVNTIEIKWAVNKPYDPVCCAYTFNSTQLQQFTSYGEFGYMYLSNGWNMPVGYRTMTIYDSPQ